MGSVRALRRKYVGAIQGAEAEADLVGCGRIVAGAAGCHQKDAGYRRQSHEQAAGTLGAGKGIHKTLLSCTVILMMPEPGAAGKVSVKKLARYLPCRDGAKISSLHHTVGNFGPTLGRANEGLFAFFGGIFRSPDSHAIGEQDGEYDSILDRLADVGFYEPVIMHHSEDSGQIDKAVQTLPVLASEAADRPRGRGQGQRNHENEGGEPNGDEGALGDVFQHFMDVEKLVEPD